MKRKPLLLALTLLAPCFQSCASDRFAEVEGHVVGLGTTLEQGALDLQTIGAGHALMATAAEQRYATAAGFAAEMQREAHRYYQGRRDVDAHVESLTKSLVGGGAAAGVCLQQVRGIQQDMQVESADLDEFGDMIKTRIQLVSGTLQELVQARDTGEDKEKDTRRSETLEQLFSRLEGEFPHWKSDISGIRDDYHDQIVSLTTGCDPGGDGCEPLALIDPARSVKRLESFGELAKKLEADWGKEIAAELRGYITRHPEGLLLDVVTVASNHAQLLRALQTKLGWVETALVELQHAR